MDYKFEPKGAYDYAVTVGSEQPFSLRQHLGFGDLDEDVDTQPGWQAFWRATAARYNEYADEFALIEYRKYMAHCRMYAVLALKGIGDRPTLESILDRVVLIFSEDTTEGDYERYVSNAYIGALGIVGEKKGAKASVDHGSIRYKDFHDQMSRYRRDGVHFEMMERKRLALKRAAEELEALAEGSSQRGFMLNNKTKLER